jgi:hypothetical protein
MGDIKISWKKGLNRIFIVVAIGWIGFALWYLPVRVWHEQIDLLNERWSTCLYAARNSNAADYQAAVVACNKERDKDRHEIPHTAWSDLGRNGWFWLMGVAVVPPLIAYLATVAISQVFMWIWRGFKQ